MKLPLLIGARPLYVKQGALVPLGVGNWTVTGNQKDSQILIDCIVEDDSVTYTLDNPTGLKFRGPCWVRAIIKSGGKEETLDIYAEKMEGK